MEVGRGGFALLLEPRTLHSWYACDSIHPDVQQNTTSDVTWAQHAPASRASFWIQIVRQRKKHAITKRQLLHLINRTSSSSNPKLYCCRNTNDVAETAGPAQQQTSKNRQGTGQDFSPSFPGWKQQHPPYIPWQHL